MTEKRFQCTCHTHEIAVGRYEDKRANGEWFALSDSDVAFIKSISRMRGGNVER